MVVVCPFVVLIYLSSGTYENNSIRLYSDGKLISEYQAEGIVSISGDHYTFRDAKTHKTIMVSGTVILGAE